jgi:hypothetical protein
MDVKQAVQIAKTYVADLFAEENIQQLRLEEVEFDEAGAVWRVTIGFSRPWSRTGLLASELLNPPRAYKVVQMRDEDGQVISVKDRSLAAA